VRYFFDKQSGMKIRVVVNSRPKVEFTAKISKIDAKGLMTVQFSDPIVAPQNYSGFNDQFIRMKIINEEMMGQTRHCNHGK
jgi:hypothetical protein